MSRNENEEKFNTTLRIGASNEAYEEDEEEEEDESGSQKRNTRGIVSHASFITVENEDGDLDRLQFDLDDNQFTIQDPHFRNGYPGNKMHPKLNANSFQKLYERSRNLNKHTDEQQKKARKRIVSKSGQCNVESINVPKKKRLYVRDVFVTMVDSPWRYTLTAFAASFFVTWLIFAGIYYLICWVHGDLEPENIDNSDWKPCVWAIKNFASTFLFSVETQHTIGYGTRSTSEECASAIIVMCIQSVVGVLFSSCMAGIVFAKLARPKYRTNTVIFSKNAVITMQNGALYLIFRVSNIRKSHIIESHVSAKLIRRFKMSKEGEVSNYNSEYLKIVSHAEEGEDDRCFFMFPSTMIHKINEDSPFYSMSPKDILDAQFEMVVILEGIVEPTGNSFQARSSYLPREILWGMRFENMVSYSTKLGKYKVDVSHLNAVIPDDTPRLSMEMIDRQRKKKASRSQVYPPRIFSPVRSQSLVKAISPSDDCPPRFTSSIVTIDGDISHRRMSSIETSSGNFDKLELDMRRRSLDSAMYNQGSLNNNSTHGYHAITVPVPEESNDSFE